MCTVCRRYTAHLRRVLVKNPKTGSTVFKFGRNMVQAKMAIRVFLTLLVLVPGGLATEIGINWGTMASHTMLPNVVAHMLKANGIKKVKLFDTDPWTMSSLVGNEFEVMVAIPNDQLHHISESYDNAQEWVKKNASRYDFDGGVKIKYVAVGNEPFLKSYNGSFMNVTFPALQYIQQALDEAGLGQKIKATIPLNADVYESPSIKPVPSAGNFRHDIRDLMTQIVRFLHSHDAPFVVNIYPFLSLYQNINFPVDFAFFDGGGNPLEDNDVQYTNVFDANYDTLVWSLKKAGVPNLKIIVGEIGWPTDGDRNGNMAYAQKFYDGFLKKMASQKGTPLRPGSMDVYLFSLIDEDQKSVAPGDFERHWGLFQYDGKPKFPIDLSGKGNDRDLVPAKGVVYLPDQWCVLNKGVKNLSTLAQNVNYACTYGDCTTLGYGSSCNGLDVAGNASYAFNMYFQMQDQDVEACSFQGLGVITKTDPTIGTCRFPVQIVSAGKRVRFGSTSSVVMIMLVLISLAFM